MRACVTVITATRESVPSMDRGIAVTTMKVVTRAGVLHEPQSESLPYGRKVLSPRLCSR